MIKNLIKKIPFIVKIFHSYKYFLQRKKIEKILQLKNNEKDDPEIVYGIYEGIVFFTSCLLTTFITEHITFNQF